MNWIDIETLKTVAGASVVVALLVAVLKEAFNVSGRATQIVALGVSLVVGGLIGSWHSVTGVILTFINSVVIFAAAMGYDQVFNYKKG
jgi:hypothetical protein